MASLIGSGINSGASQNMANGWGQLQAYADPGNIFGGNSAQAMDPIGYGIFNALGIENWNPLQVAVNKIPGFHGNGAKNTNGGVPSVLPTLPGIGKLQIYNPNSFGGYANLSAGPFNAMAAQLAGPQYQPQLMSASSARPAVPSNGGAAAQALPGKGGSALNLANPAGRFYAQR